MHVTNGNAGFNDLATSERTEPKLATGLVTRHDVKPAIPKGLRASSFSTTCQLVVWPLPLTLDNASESGGVVNTFRGRYEIDAPGLSQTPLNGIGEMNGWSRLPGVRPGTED